MLCSFQLYFLHSSTNLLSNFGCCWFSIKLFFLFWIHFIIFKYSLKLLEILKYKVVLTLDIQKICSFGSKRKTQNIMQRKHYIFNELHALDFVLIYFPRLLRGISQRYTILCNLISRTDAAFNDNHNGLPPSPF